MDSRRSSFSFVITMKQETKHTLQLISSIILVVFGCVLISIGFFVRPMGEIHPSVLTAFGEILTFAGAVIGVDYNYKYKHEKDNKEE